MLLRRAGLHLRWPMIPKKMRTRTFTSSGCSGRGGNILKRDDCRIGCKLSRSPRDPKFHWLKQVIRQLMWKPIVQGHPGCSVCISQLRVVVPAPSITSAFHSSGGEKRTKSSYTFCFRRGWGCSLKRWGPEISYNQTVLLLKEEFCYGVDAFTKGLLTGCWGTAENRGQSFFIFGKH